MVNIVHCHWNDFRYPKIPVYINSIRFIDDLRMLKIWCCAAEWCEDVPKFSLHLPVRMLGCTADGYSVKEN